MEVCIYCWGTKIRLIWGEHFNCHLLHKSSSCYSLSFSENISWMWLSSHNKRKFEDSYSVSSWKNQIFLQPLWSSSYYKGKSEDSYSVCTWENQISLPSVWPSIYSTGQSEDSYSVCAQKKSNVLVINVIISLYMTKYENLSSQEIFLYSIHNSREKLFWICWRSSDEYW